ncbi:hypothetical protein D046_7218 [Vibrio parahaemolyticus V-223/04]|nr:hypothetical protein D046_7218 [Vibrio parahaemolyticus V-223/04]
MLSFFGHRNAFNPNVLPVGFAQAVSGCDTLIVGVNVGIDTLGQSFPIQRMHQIQPTI